MFLDFSKKFTDDVKVIQSCLDYAIIYTQSDRIFKFNFFLKKFDELQLPKFPEESTIFNFMNNLIQGKSSKSI